MNLFDNLIIIIYLTTIFLLVASYILYPVFIALIPKKRFTKKINLTNSRFFLIIPTYNEESSIIEKLNNSFGLDHFDQLIIYVVDDQSDDNTVPLVKDYIKSHSSIVLIEKEKRGGKNDSINIAIDQIEPEPEDILVFTDANTFFNKDALRHLKNHLEQGAAMVAGSMVYVDQHSGSAKSEGLYWKYEEWIRKNESKLGKLITANGGIFAIRAKFFEPQPSYVPNDFELPLRLIVHELVLFNEKAIGKEVAINNVKEELNRKKRMANRQTNAIKYLFKRLSLIVFFQLLLHKIVRWYGVGLFILSSTMIFYLFLFTNQNSWVQYLTIFHFSIVIVLMLSAFLKNHITIFYIINYAFLVHWYAMLGSLKALFGGRITTWNKAESNR